MDAEARARFATSAEARLREALPRALETVDAVARLGFRAEVMGSLADGAFSPYSDVDFLVDCPRGEESKALDAAWETMDYFPFDMAFRSRVDPASLALMTTRRADREPFALALHRLRVFAGHVGRLTDCLASVDERRDLLGYAAESAMDSAGRIALSCLKEVVTVADGAVDAGPENLSTRVIEAAARASDGGPDVPEVLSRTFVPEGNGRDPKDVVGAAREFARRVAAYAERHPGYPAPHPFPSGAWPADLRAEWEGAFGFRGAGPAAG